MAIGANSGPAVKTWVNATISITPSAFNEVNAPHTFTATLMKDAGTGALVPAAGETVTVTLTSSNGACPVPPGPFTGTTDAAGQFAVTFTSSCPGTVTGHAESTLAVNGSAPFTIATDSSGGNSGDATKVFQDANIQITPNGTNRVGASHTFTAHVNADLGEGGGFQNAPDGTVITFTTVDANGATSTPNPPTSCTTAGGTGSCTTTISSPTTGTSTVSAHTTFTTPGGVILTRSTDGTGANSGPAVKTWVNARISITPNATNEVGQPHTFTVALEKDLGDGAGFVPAAGETVTVTLTNSNGATRNVRPALHHAGTTDAAGHLHGHLHLGHPRAGHRQRQLDRHPRHAGAVHGHDRRGRPQQRPGGQDVRRRQHPDHAPDSHQPGQHRPHADRSTSTSTPDRARASSTPRPAPSSRQA